MANSIVTYTGDGTTTLFTVPFPYLDQGDVSVFVSGTSTAFTWNSPTQVSISPAPAASAHVLIQRNTDVSALEVAFADASTMQASDFNSNALQALYMVQELLDLINQIMQTSLGTTSLAQFQSLPTTLPTNSGVLWNDGGVISIS